MADNVLSYIAIWQNEQTAVCFTQCYCWVSTLLQSSSDVLHLHAAVQRKWDFFTFATCTHTSLDAVAGDQFHTRVWDWG